MERVSHPDTHTNTHTNKYIYEKIKHFELDKACLKTLHKKKILINRILSNKFFFVFRKI